MKKKLLLLILFSLCLNAVSSRNHTAVAQSRGTITFSVVDSLSREPVGYAAVLLYPDKDTVAAYYGQTDIDGKVTIDKIKKGVYTVRTELLGYVTRTQKVSVEGGTQDLGTIAMQEDYKMLEGAKVTATGNSIIIKQDTIEYIASSVKLGTNAVLLDLLKKLPGIEVDEDGNVKAQGETITRITLNGKTFFLNDPSIATDNIPANIIEKVRVIDKKSEQAIFSGIEDDNKEKVIDVKTYSGMGDGWIGNFTGGLGTDLPAANKESIFENTSDLRYNGSAMLGRIQDKNQIFFIGGGNNVNEGAFGRRNRGGMGGGSGSGNGSSGITDSWNTGLNFNTSRFKNLELTPSINGGGTRTLNESQEEKTTFRREGSDMHSSDTSRNLSHNNTLSAGIELKYTPERVRITFSPRFSFTNSNSQRQSASTTGSLGDTYDILNDAYSYNYSTSRNLSSQGNLMVGFRIGEKAGRTITVSGNWTISEGDDDAKEFSETNYYQTESVKLIDQYSHTDSRNIGFGGELRYTEPISEYWFLTGSYRVSYRHNTSNKDTYDYCGSTAHNRGNASSFVGTMDNAAEYTCGPRNDYYSSEVDNTYINQNIGLAMQLQKGRNFVQAGASLQPTYNETFTRSFGTESHLGEGEWLLNWAPEVRARYALNENSNINGSYQGRSSQPSNSRMQPILNVSNPTAISTGNAYLLPSFSHSVNMRYSTNNKKRFSSFFGGLTASRDIGSVVTASWFDNDGIRYSIPVNSKKPSNNISADASYNTPIGKSKFNVSASLRGSLGTSVSYQNTSPRGGIDAAKFDYTTFMEEFWGNDSAGRKFYSGESGFGESQTNTYSTSESLNVRYNGDVISFNVGGTSRYSHATYSLNSAANRTTWNNTINGELFVNIRKITWSTDYNYNFYRGYSDGFNEPEFIWNMSLNAAIRKINITASIHDILAQSRNIVRTTTENYVSDRMTNRLGRYFMVTATYRFGSFPGMKGRNMRGGGMGGPMMMPGGAPGGSGGGGFGGGGFGGRP